MPSSNMICKGELGTCKLRMPIEANNSTQGPSIRNDAIKIQNPCLEMSQLQFRSLLWMFIPPNDLPLFHHSNISYECAYAPWRLWSKERSVDYYPPLDNDIAYIPLFAIKDAASFESTLLLIRSIEDLIMLTV